MIAFGRNPASVIDGAQFGRDIERLLWHLGFEGVTNVDGAGDQGGDLIAARGGVRYVFQCKYKRSGNVGTDAITEVVNAREVYGAAIAVVVTNADFSKPARDSASRIQDLTGVRILLWDGESVDRLWASGQCSEWFGRHDLRPYQADAFVALKHDLETKHRALLVLATGLGKTVIAGNCVEWFRGERRDARILVVSHTLELVGQLERALWRHLPKTVPTQQLTGDSKPYDLSGLTSASIPTALTFVKNGYRPDFIFIDEAHHVGEDSQFVELVDSLPEALVLGVTATPWRGDHFNIEHVFGEAAYKLGIEEGMRLGFLCDVDYKVFLDNVDWSFVQLASKRGFTIADLNQRLFLPQRDEQIRDELLKVWDSTRNPRAIVFCQTVEHARRMHELLSRVTQWRQAALVHSDMHKRDRQVNLMNFRSGACPLLVAVDVLNEGVDVPDVNIVCFARVTHSRRIFVQQLGRGLRLSPEKERVTVLDFVSDLRRVASLLELRKQLAAEYEDIHLPASHRIEFTDAKAETLMAEWLKDAADLETASDQSRLNFLGSVGS
jgi:superfamily II DNA or RNA helicase